MNKNNKQRGFMIMPVVICIVLVISVAGSYFAKQIAHIDAGGNATLNQSRLDQAANAAMNWAKLQSKSGQCTPSVTFSGNKPLPGYSDLTAVVTCSSVSAESTVYTLTATACNTTTCPMTTPSAGYMERKVTQQYVPTFGKRKQALMEWMWRKQPFLFYDFEENAPLLLHDYGNSGNVSAVYHFDSSLNDATANAWHMTNSGAISYSNTPRMGSQDLYLSGGAYAYRTAATFLNFNSSNFTIDFWFRSTDTRALTTMVSRQSCAANASCWNGGDFLILLSNDQANGTPGIYSAERGWLMTSNASGFNDGKYHHFAWMKNGSNHYMFIDGVLRATATGYGTLTNNTNPQLTLGKDIKDAVGQYTGYIDELRISRENVYAGNFKVPLVPYLSTGQYKFSPLFDKMGADQAAWAVNPVMTQSSDNIRSHVFAGSNRAYLNTLKASDLTNGVSMVALAQPDANTANTSSGGQRMWDASTERGTSQNNIAVAHALNALELSSRVGDAAGTTSTVNSSNIGMAPSTWGIFGTNIATNGTTAFYNGAAASGGGATQAVSLVDRQYNVLGGSTDGTSNFTGRMGIWALYKKPLTTQDYLDFQTGWQTSSYPTELVFRSDDETLTDRLNHALTDSNVVTAMGTLDMGASWYFSQGTANSKRQYMYFDSNDFVMGSGDFTVEMYIMPFQLTSSTSQNILFDFFAGDTSQGVQFGFQSSNGQISVTHANTTFILGPTVTSGLWNHIALQRKAGVFTLYVNRNPSSSVTRAVNMQANRIWVGSPGNGGNGFNGYIKDIRLWKGVALY